MITPLFSLLALLSSPALAATGVVKFGECSTAGKPIRFNYNCKAKSVEEARTVKSPLRIGTDEIVAASKLKQPSTIPADCPTPDYYRQDHNIGLQYFSWLDIKGVSFDGWVGCEVRTGSPCGVYACAVRPDVRPELYDCDCQPA